LFFNEVYTYFYFFAEIFCFIIKGANLLYPPDTMGVELACLVFYLFFCLGRNYIGTIGNKTETSSYLIFFLLFSFVPFFSNCYFMVLQTYSLKIEVILNVIGMIFVSLEYVFCLIAVIVIGRHEKSM
jgi:transmembrane protein 216